MNRRFLVFFFGIVTTATLSALGTYSAPSGPSPAQSKGPPTTAADFYAAGYVASQAGKFDEAIGDFSSAIKLKADYAEAFNMLGYCLRKTGKIQDSMSNYVKALTLKPNFPEAREYYGEAFLMDNNLNGAVSQYLILEKDRRREAAILLSSIADYLKLHPTPVAATAP